LKKLTLYSSNPDKRHNLCIKINNIPITLKHNLKFLGVFLDENLNWKEHINFVASKISRSIGIIAKAKFFLSHISLTKLYYSLVYPYLYYGNIVWGSTYETNLRRINVLQKRIIRIITKSDFRAHTAPLFQNYNLLNLKNIHLFQIGQFMFSFQNNLLPKCFNNLFHKNSDVHNYNTRQKDNYRTIKTRTNIKQFTISCEGAKVWNSIPHELKSTTSQTSFKLKFKKYLIDQ